MKQRITIRDVAREAGVSHQTVSRVINNKGVIRPATRQRVLTAIQKLDFRPSRTARSLATQRTQSIGLIVPNIANPYFGEIASGVQEVARVHDYNVFLCSTGWDPEEELQLLYSLASQPVDGIILCSSRCSHEELLAFFDTYRPITLGGRILEHRSVSILLRDSVGGMRLAINHLLQQGHQAIGMLAGPITAVTMSNAIHTDGFRQALKEFSVPVNEKWIVHNSLTADGGYHAALKLLNAHGEITAICAHNDLMAIGAIKACKELGRRVPEDCAVIGYNDISLAAMVDPPLTTVRVDTQNIGRQHMQRLIEMINEPDKQFSPLVLPSNHLTVRGSG